MSRIQVIAKNVNFPPPHPPLPHPPPPPPPPSVTKQFIELPTSQWELKTESFVRIGKMGDPGLSLKMEKCSVHGAKIDAKMTLGTNVTLISLKAVITLK